jgi:hypothetical protein
VREERTVITDIVAYVYQADIHCPAATARLVERDIDQRYGTYAGRMDYETVEEYLDRAAKHLGIDRYDEWTYDSNDFPKIVFADQMEDYR